jgi:hypothetical protein
VDPAILAAEPRVRTLKLVGPDADIVGAARSAGRPPWRATAPGTGRSGRSTIGCSLMDGDW